MQPENVLADDGQVTELEVEDPQVEIQKLKNKIENMKLKMEDFNYYSKKIQNDKMEQVRKNNGKINLIADMIYTNMGELFKEVLEQIRQRDVRQTGSDHVVDDEKLQKELWQNAANTALTMIEELKEIYNEGSSVVNE